MVTAGKNRRPAQFTFEMCDLAAWFVTEVLEEPFFDTRLHWRHLQDARWLLKPGAIPIAEWMIQEACCAAVAESATRVTSLRCVLWDAGDGRSYLQHAATPQEPDHWSADYDLWFQTRMPRWLQLDPTRYWSLAVYKGWDGISRTPEKGPITYDLLVSLVGPDLAQMALVEYSARLAAWRHAHDRLRLVPNDPEPDDLPTAPSQSPPPVA